MACSVVSIAMNFLAWALVLSSSMPKVASISPASSLIKEVCVGTEFRIDFNFCVQVLNSEPRVVSASGVVDMSIAIINAGISRAKKTQWYVRKLQKQPGVRPDFSYVLRQCEDGYKNFLQAFAIALDSVQEQDYLTATFQLKAGFEDYIDQCRNALTSKKVQDGVISKGNKFMVLFGEVAFQIVDDLIT